MVFSTTRSTPPPSWEAGAMSILHFPEAPPPPAPTMITSHEIVPGEAVMSAFPVKVRVLPKMVSWASSSRISSMVFEWSVIN